MKCTNLRAVSSEESLTSTRDSDINDDVLEEDNVVALECIKTLYNIISIKSCCMKKNLRHWPEYKAFPEYRAFYGAKKNALL